MRLTIFLLVVLFIFIAFFGKLSYVIDNPFLAYLFYILNLSVKFFPIILIIFISLSGTLIWRHYKHKHSKKRTFHSFFLIFEVLTISIFSAFIILFLIGFIQLNTYSFIINKNPALLGIITNAQQIYNHINNNDTSPTIVTSDKDFKTNIIAIAKASSGTDNFYGEVILSNIPKLLILPINKEVPNLLFLDNTLIITNVYLEDMQKLSPLIGNLFIKNYFPTMGMKANPRVYVLDSKEYQIFRKEDAQEKLNKIISESKKMKDSVSSISAAIQETEQEIDLNKNDLLSILEERDREYNACLSEGSYDENKTFIPDNTKSDCQPILDKWETQFINEEIIGKNLAIKLDKDQKKLKVYEYYNSFFKAQEQLSDISLDSIPSELGVFIPDNTLKVVLLEFDGETIPNYFITLTHEYLHYASYVPGKRLESSFFEEGLTEYFARQVIKNSMNIEVNIGYPIAYRIIKQITKRVSEADLADIYFTKDQALLESTLDLVYGEGFYINNIVYFESLMYSVDDDQALDLANKIIKNIDGDPLNENEVYSNIK